MPTAANENEIVEPTWVVLQLTRIATYSIADEATTLLWAMSVDTKRPLEGVRAEVEGQSSNTDQSGIARLKTPDADLNQHRNCRINLSTHIRHGRRFGSDRKNKLRMGRFRFIRIPKHKHDQLYFRGSSFIPNPR